MKKCILILLLLAISIHLAACREAKSIPPLSEIETLSDQQLIDTLSDFSADEIHAALGEPDGHTFGFWADIYQFPGSRKVVFIYYDTEGNVDTVKTDYRNE